MVVRLFALEGGIPQVCPEYCEHAQAVGVFEGFGNLLNLPRGFLRTVVDRGAHRYSPHLEGLVHAGKQHLVVLARVGEQLIVVDLDDKGDPVGPLAGYRAQNAEGGGYGVAAALHGQLHDVLRIEVQGIRRERGTRRMFDTLIHRQDGQVSGSGQPAVVEHASHVSQDLYRPVADGQDAVDKIGARQMQLLLGNCLAIVLEQILALLA